MCEHSKIKGFTSRGYVTGVDCGLWSCPDCSRQQAKKWAWRVKLECQNRPSTRPIFITFTLPGYISNVPYGFARIVILWDRYRRDMQKRIKQGEYPGVERFTYCAFVEGQPKRGGMPHFHIIQFVQAPVVSTRKVDPIKDYAASIGWGHQAKEEVCTGVQVAGYVAKYATKQHPRTPKGFRRVRTSQGWAELPDFTGVGIMVKSRKETLTNYLLRVNTVTAVPIDTLYQRWTDAHDTE